MTPSELIAAFGPVGGVFIYLWINRAQPKSEKTPDPLKQIETRLDHIVTSQADIKTDLAILLDRRGK